MVILILTAAVGVSVSQKATMERMGAATPTIKRWGGWVLITLGTWFILLSAFSSTFEGLFPV